MGLRDKWRFSEVEDSGDDTLNPKVVRLKLFCVYKSVSLYDTLLFFSLVYFKS